MQETLTYRLGMTATLHQSDERLELYALGRLPDSDSTLLEEHLLVCELCRESLDQVEAYALAMRSAVAGEPVGAVADSWFRGFFQFKTLLFAGGFAAAVLLAVLYLHPRPNVAPLASLELTAMRGSMVSIKPARETDILLADAPAQLSTPVQMVDASGGTVWNGIPDSPSHTIRVVKELAPGSYFVRLFNSNGVLLHEYGFQVQAP